MFRPCIVIPIYNNKDTIGGVVDRLRPFNLPILIANDGSSQATVQVLDALSANHEQVHVKHLARNGGKGNAVKTGLLWAHELGYSHALQVDADGQHQMEDAPKFLQAAEKDPEALVLGTPTFGDSVPKIRLYGRELSKFCVRVETLGRAIADPLFGFRSYPLAAAADTIKNSRIGNRMDFDPEIAVRLCWRGCPIVNIPTPVFYPEGGVSHFRMVHDNILITWLHIRMVFGMIFRLPARLVKGKW